MKHETELILKSNKSLVENKQTTSLNNHYLNISMETIFVNTENNKTNVPRKSVLNLSQQLDFQTRKFKQTCYSSKFIYLLHVKKYQKTL